MSHPPLVAVDTQSPSESLKKSQSIKLNVENKTSQGHAAFFETVEKVGGGNSGSVYRVRNTPLLCKMFGGMEGHSGYYKREHFIREVNAYSRLRALGGIAVPRFYGAFERGDLLKAAIFLEDCGKALLSFDQMEPEET